MIRIQQDDFDHDAIINELRQRSSDIGAIVTFTGIVREFVNELKLDGIFLEHYPGMTERVLEDLSENATTRWDLLGTAIIHRVGHLSVNDNIVLVATAARHRKEAFEAAQYLMDKLKTEAPFWKKEVGDNTEYWVESRSSDQDASDSWS